MKIFSQARCLLCHERMLPVISWSTLFSAEKATYVCPECEGKLEKISGKTCRMCNRPFANLEEKFRHGDVCNDCVRWEDDPEWRGCLDKNLSLFLYNDFLKEVIARFKFRGDYMIARVFAEPFQKQLNELTYDLLVPIPLSEERLYERGFNQAEALIVESGFTPAHVLSRIHTEKQSKKARNERIHFPQVFQMAGDQLLAGKRIVLIDDIYTTGSTIRHAAKILKEAGAAQVQSLTLAR